jgi:hypothetical protein
MVLVFMGWWIWLGSVVMDVLATFGGGVDTVGEGDVGGGDASLFQSPWLTQGAGS